MLDEARAEAVMLPSRPWLASLLLLPALLIVSPAGAGLVDVTPTANPWVTNADEDWWVDSAAAADVDGDGDLDLVMLGYYVVYNVSAEHRLVVFLNEGPDGSGRWTFTESPVGLGDLYSNAPDLAFADADGDGDPDLAVGTAFLAALYRNDAGALVQTDTVLPGYSEDASGTSAFDLRSITWADYDNDGDPDLLMPSVFDDATFTYSTRLLRNDGPNGTGGILLTDVSATLDPTAHVQAEWRDDDGDEDLDLLVADIVNVIDTGFIRRYANEGGTFTGADLLPVRVHVGTVDWDDYDGDTDLDVLVAGNLQEADGSYATVLRVYRNDGGTYAPTTLPGNWLDYNAAEWADYDCDGDADIIVSGSFVGPVEIEGRTTVYANVAGSFSDIGLDLPSPFSSIGGGGAFTWFDVDGDGDLDYFMTGGWYVPGGAGLVETRLHLYLNEPASTNFAPAPPGNLSSSPTADGARLAWDPATDDRTPATALTYDLRVRPRGAGTAPNARVPGPGNVGASTSWHVRGLPDGVYEWSVRAIDASQAAGAEAGGAFTVGSGVAAPPAVGDGRVTEPVRVGKIDPAGTSLLITWDAATCPAASNHIVYGVRAQLPPGPGAAFGAGGGECGVATPHAWTSVPAGDGLLWFVVVASDGAGTEGSWGLDSRLSERIGPAASGGSGVCGLLARDVSSACGR